MIHTFFQFFKFVSLIWFQVYKFIFTFTPFPVFGGENSQNSTTKSCGHGTTSLNTSLIYWTVFNFFVFLGSTNDTLRPMHLWKLFPWSLNSFQLDSDVCHQENMVSIYISTWACLIPSQNLRSLCKLRPWQPNNVISVGPWSQVRTQDESECRCPLLYVQPSGWSILGAANEEINNHSGRFINVV